MLCSGFVCCVFEQLYIISRLEGRWEGNHIRNAAQSGRHQCKRSLHGTYEVVLQIDGHLCPQGMTNYVDKSNTPAYKIDSSSSLPLLFCKMLTKQLLFMPLPPQDCLQLALLGFLDANLRWLPTQTERERPPLQSI